MGISQKSNRAPKTLAEKLSLRKAVLLVVIVALCLPLAREFWSHFSISRTNSAGAHCFWSSFDFKRSDISQNKYVMFNLITKYEPLCAGPKGCRVIKRVACDEGSRIDTVGKEFYCNGAFLGKAKDKSQKGHILKSYSYTGVIPHGYAFMLNDNPDSYDSRYYGLVKKDYVIAMVTPLF